MENDAVFTSTHRFIVDLVAQRKVDGFASTTPMDSTIPRNIFVDYEKL